MEILEILQKSGENLYPEDLDFFETELATGGLYDAAYQAQCIALIKRLRTWMNSEEIEEAQQDAPVNAPKGLVMDLDSIAPQEANDAANNMSPEERLFREIKKLREDSAYKSKFKKYIATQSIVDESFIEKHYAFFEEWELNAIVSVKPLGEPFLEKYFGALNHDKIARYQHFSEAFFMKHFAQMDYTIVLQRGKNEWRKKENRSKQLDVFLRLKGVKI